MDELDLGATIRGFSAGQRIFKRYTLQRQLGRGGMGVVWLARDEELGRDTALKFLPEVVATDRAAIADMKREVRRAIDLAHPHIVKIHDFVTDGHMAAVSMEYVAGDTLSALRVDQPGQLFTADQLAPWVAQLCSALDYAHGTGEVVHRDLKPVNLMVNQRGDLKVLDFGIAASLSESVTRVSKQAGSSGTPVYMSPQQMMGGDPAVTDDVYALGATLYELLTGKPPFFAGNILIQVQSKVPALVNERRKVNNAEGEPVPAAWEETIAACLAKEPQDRPQSVGEVAERLGVGPAMPAARSLSGGMAAKSTRNAKTESPALPPKTQNPKSKAPLVAGLAVAVIALAGLGWYFGVHAPEQKRQNEAVAQVEREKIQAAERLRAEKAEQERLAQEKVEQERLAQEKAAALEKERREAEAAARLLAEKLEAERVARVAAEAEAVRILAEKEKAERKRIADEQAAAARAIDLERNRKAAELARDAVKFAQARVDPIQKMKQAEERGGMWAGLAAGLVMGVDNTDPRQSRADWQGLWDRSVSLQREFAAGRQDFDLRTLPQSSSGRLAGDAVAMAGSSFAMALVITGSPLLRARDLPESVLREADEFRKMNAKELAARGQGVIQELGRLQTALQLEVMSMAQDQPGSAQAWTATPSVKIVGRVDRLAVIVNAANPIRDLSQRQIEQIFTGDIADWSQFGRSSGKITPYIFNNADPLYASFKAQAMQRRDYAASSQRTSGGEQIVAEVAKNRNGIGYCDSDYVRNFLAGSETNQPTQTSLELLAGVSMVPLTAELRQANRLDDKVTGLLIRNIAETSPYKGNLPVGAVLEQINRVPVTDFNSGKAALKQGRNITLVYYKGAYRYVAFNHP